MVASRVTAPSGRPRRMDRAGGSRSGLLPRLMWAESRRSHAIWIVPVLVAVGTWFALEYSQVDLLFWRDVSANIAMTFVMVGPVCSAWGAWLAGREARYRLTELVSAGPTGSIHRDAVVFGTSVLGGLIAYALIALMVGGYTATYATWGGPGWSILLFGALVTAVMVLCGSVFGRIWPSRIAPFIAFVVPLLYTTLTYSYFTSWDGQRWLAPYAYIMDWKQFSGNFLYERPDSWFRGSLAGGTLVACGALLLMFGLMAGVRRSWVVTALCGVAAVSLLVSGRAMTQPDYDAIPAGAYVPPQPVQNPPLACAGEVVVTCLHKVYEPELADAAERVDAMFAPIAGLTGVPERIEQRADLESTDDVVRIDQIWTYGVLPPGSAAHDLLWPVLTTSLPIREGGKLTMPQHVIARWLTMKVGGFYYASDFYFAGAAAEIESPYEAAAEQRRTEGGTSIMMVPQDEQFAYQEALADYDQQVREAADRFAALSPEEQRTWLEANWDALRAGELTLEDLP